MMKKILFLVMAVLAAASMMIAGFYYPLHKWRWR